MIPPEVFLSKPAYLPGSTKEKAAASVCIGLLVFLIVFAFTAVSLWLPFFLDRLLYRRLPGFFSTLVLPIAFMLVEYAVSLLSPYGAWGCLGATQMGHAAFAQIASVTGRWGITFLVMWFPSVLNWIMENGTNRRACVKGAAIFGGILLAVLVYGNVRLNSLQAPTPTVRAAGISPSNAENGCLAGAVMLVMVNAAGARKRRRAA
jgi:apolipoprotein N-acyltransferase